MLGASFGAVGIVLVIASASYACTNYVGYLKVFGNASGSGTVTATGNQTYGDPLGGMTQTVSSTTAKAPASGTGSITVITASISTAKSLGTATYDVNWIQIGYSTHGTWLNPLGDCMSWRVPSLATNLGTISITNGAGQKGFTLPTRVANTGTQESGVCVSDSGSNNGNQAPLLII